MIRAEFRKQGLEKFLRGTRFRKRRSEKIFDGANFLNARSKKIICRSRFRKRGERVKMLFSGCF
jgi:hypothetical protein